MPDIYITPDDRLQAVFDGAVPGTVIHLAPGVYRQKVMITTPDLTVVGSGWDKTRIVFDDYAKKPDPQGFAYITFRSYTVAVCADGLTIRDLSIVNDAKAPEVKGQEVALSVVADRFLMENCTLTSTQDTLFAGPLPEDLIERYEGFLQEPLRRGGRMRQTYRNCRIEGTVDFIFGCAEALFESCELRSLRDARNIGFVAAPAHGLEQSGGLRFVSCSLTCEAGVTPGSVFLARPWRDHGIVSFEHCSYGPHIAAAGFDKWNDTDRDQTARFFEMPPLPNRVAWINRKTIT